MFSFLITIICLNLDALSYGISYGVIQTKINLKYIFFINIISTSLFSIPLYISKYIYTLFNPKILRYTNAIILIILGIFPQDPLIHLSISTSSTVAIIPGMRLIKFSRHIFFLITSIVTLVDWFLAHIDPLLLFV